MPGKNTSSPSFPEKWAGRGDEKSETQIFWLELLHDVLGIEKPGEFIEFEKRVELSHVSFIDGYIPSTGIIIEQKSRNVDLDSPAKQSDGSVITPFEQAKRYYDWLPASQRGRYIIVSNFSEIRIHDMETPKAPPAKIIQLHEILREKASLSNIVITGRKLPDEVDISIKAGELVGKLYDSLLERYINPNDKASQRSLNIFCVRIVFLLYAEDSGLFEKSQFHDYLNSRRNMARDSLRKLFSVLNTEIPKRDPYLEDELRAFPFVNGGLFEENEIELPQLDGEPLRIILEDMAESFDWSGISPTIFGAVFESTLNPKTRHTGGMHYTSIENIHRVIDPLFLDTLREEAKSAISTASHKEMRKFQKKLASLKFFDPACGSGNFLTETYLSLRRLENEIIRELSRGQITFAFSKEESPVQVSISQFYGIELNDFAVAVARTALWIAETQMLTETKAIVQVYEDILPLKSYNFITEENALEIDWNSIVSPSPSLFVIGNPPYLGYSSQNGNQKKEILNICGNGKLDYVAGWYWKACRFIHGTGARAAFVSTNSVFQGEQVSMMFKPLHDELGINIDFAYPPFVWDSEAEEKAHVHVAVVGFDSCEWRMRRLYAPEGVITAENINFYLVPGPTQFAEPQSTPLQESTPPARRGSQATDGSNPKDGGNLIMTFEEKEELLKSDPEAAKFIRPFMMGVDFINRKPRYCLWLVDASPKDLAKCPRVMERIKRVKEFRLSSKKPATQRKAQTPYLFDEIVECETNYVAIPVVSSEKRSYIPMDWLSPEIIPGNKLFTVKNASLYHFGVLMSRVHMAWMRRVTGRLKSDYSYGNTTVYNTFAWPNVDIPPIIPPNLGETRLAERGNSSKGAKRGHDHYAIITRTAQAILDARAKYPECSFAELYNDDIMPSELRAAHNENDAAVCEAYGWKRDISEYDIVAELFGLYGRLKGRE